MSRFLFNAWYAAAWGSEVGRSLTPRRVLGHPVVLYRREDGAPAALADRCPHRFAPLHLGRLEGDAVRCRYHGLCFDDQGRCVESPFGDRLPSGARLRPFPVVEQDSLVWLWPGEAALADPALIPRFAFLSEPATYKTLSGGTVIDAHYELGTDNLLDLTHVQFLHGQSFGDTFFTKSIRTVEQHDAGVTAKWWIPGAPSAPGFDPLFETGTRPVDVWLDLTWMAPSAVAIDIGVTEIGRPRSEGRNMLHLHLLTPEDETRTRYFWAAGRRDKQQSAEVDALLTGVLSAAFDFEDKPMLEACQRNMAGPDLMAQTPLVLGIDAAALRARRVLAELIAKEQTPAASAA
jgi:vanillate O-demethylase monooxygenase subunit